MDEIPIKGSNILGDKAYGSHAIRNYITNLKQPIPFHQNQMPKLLGMWIGIYIKNVI
ncbi:hypothetical protein ACLBXI_01520 [Bacillus cereus]